jgi:hypothetical protein
MRPCERELWSDEGGASIVEFAIVLPLMLALLAGGVDLTRAVFAYQTADKSVKAAARYAARLPVASLDAGGWGVTPVKNLALRGTLDGSGEPLLWGWTDLSTVTVLPLPPTSDLRVRLTAAVPLSFDLLPLIGLPRALTVSVSHEERHIGE